MGDTIHKRPYMTSTVMFEDGTLRAARLLQMLLLLQNRGRMSSLQLAKELEVSTRTILRDVDAMTEAGLPVVVLQGNQGGIELGFNYRTRLTGLAADEAEALSVMLTMSMPVLAALGMSHAAARASAKLIESFPDKVRARIVSTQALFQLDEPVAAKSDPRLAAMSAAVREQRIVRIDATSKSPRIVHPVGLVLGEKGWSLRDKLQPDVLVPMDKWNDVNISAKTFADNV
ncbi:MAG: HTH domain-containing protein [Hyphomonas sp.]|nr:HTH domain-containing protein [Hyphomonas sp.]